MNSRKVRVLIVDDSAIVRKVLTETIAGEPDIEVIATAPDAYIARDKVLALRPDVITLDLEMPRMDGLAFLRRLMFLHPIPTIVVSSQGQASCAGTLEALRWGAVDVIAKPATLHALRELRLTLAAKIRGAASARPRPALDVPAIPPRSTPSHRNEVVPSGGRIAAGVEELPHLTRPALAEQRAATIPSFSRSLIAIGASTGGTVAIQEVLTPFARGDAAHPHHAAHPRRLLLRLRRPPQPHLRAGGP